MKRLILIMAVLLTTGTTAISQNKTTASKSWVGTWATAPQLVEPRNMPPAPGLTNSTLRQVVCVSIGGKQLQFRFSNRFSKSPVTMKTVHIAVSKGGSEIEPSTSKELTFNGQPDVTMEPGKAVISDPISFNLKPRMLVAITISFGETSPDVTGHPGSRTTSYLLAGDQSSPDADFSQAVKTDHWYVINGIDLMAQKRAAAIAILGNSITDGRGSGTNKQDRWPDELALRLLKNKRTRDIGVLNMGIGGNCVLHGGLGPTALSRFNRDILKQHGVRWLIIFEGVNDIGGTPDKEAADKVAQGLIAAYDKMIDEAHAKGIKVYGGTITPIKKSFYYKDYRETARQTVNKWIRTSGHFDAVIDFDKAMRNPKDTLTLRPEAQSGDYLHPNELGYRIMAGAIDLSLFK
ncbi:SGNH hydrolase [Prolixibacter bellariivorans]|uniref:SGNH hydrolase n=1 Tax=Prolixibacter bellariivorans TaxID=314319 RepID=A0A5M4AV20_9BACT|nr:SGNH/GDSL hydrolase family protein [Prolixibacter bellariivorans]GET31396.1 SGNH hydrolase [Prolixibacter bellariivorans]